MAFLVVLLLPLTAALCSPLGLPPSEQRAAYLVLEAIDPSVAWRSSYPDDLCLSGPHGVVCDLFPSSPDGSGNLTLHVTELHLGFVSDSSPSPACHSSSHLPPALTASFPFLRKLSLYRCLAASAPAPLPDHFWRALPSASPALQDLVFIENPALAGRLPSDIARFASLRKLIISGSAMGGPLPLELGNLRDLQQLTLSRGRFIGEVPANLGSCAGLRILDLSGNRLGGRIPSSLGSLGELVKLDLSGNRMAGCVPPELSRLGKLELLDLGGNNLTGGVPACIGAMSSLKEVYLSGNEMLGGPVPEAVWGGLGGLVGLGLSRTGVVGGIPASMSVGLRRIAYLAMDGNALEGEVPVEMRLLEGSAMEVNLEGNRLRGALPFSPEFAGRLGGKLRLSGNEGLCWPAGAARGGGVGVCGAASREEPPLLSKVAMLSNGGSSGLRPAAVIGQLWWFLVCWSFALF